MRRLEKPLLPQVYLVTHGWADLITSIPTIHPLSKYKHELCISVKSNTHWHKYWNSFSPVLADCTVTDLQVVFPLFISPKYHETWSITVQGRAFDLGANSPCSLESAPVPPCPATALHALWSLVAKPDSEILVWDYITLLCVCVGVWDVGAAVLLWFADTGPY